MSLTPPPGLASSHTSARARQRIIELDHVHRMARALTSDHQCQPAEGQSADGALIGNMHLQEAQPGLFMRLNRVRKRADLMIRSRIEPSLKIAVVWRGEPEVSFGPRCHALKPGRALCIALDEPTEFRLNSPKGAVPHAPSGAFPLVAVPSSAGTTGHLQPTASHLPGRRQTGRKRWKTGSTTGKSPIKVRRRSPLVWA